MVGSVIFLSPRPTTSWDDERWGFATLRARGVSPVSVDLSCILGTTGAAIPRESDVRPRSMAEFSAFATARARDAVFIDFLRGVSGPDLKSAKVFRALRDSRAIYYVISGGALPGAPRGESLFKKALSRPGRAAHHLWWLASRAGAERFGGYYPPARIFGPKSEVVSSFGARYRIPADRMIPSHSLDYEMLLTPAPTAGERSGLCVFVDDGIAGHPDFERGGRRAANADDYFALLRGLFDVIERKTGRDVVFAAHPRGVKVESDAVGGRRVVLGQTAPLVRSASLVIGHASTALGLAVLTRKPLLLLTGRHTADAGLSGNVAGIASATGAPMVDLDDAVAIAAVDPAAIEVSETKYADYVEKFIRDTGAREESLWDLVADYGSRDLGGSACQ